MPRYSEEFKEQMVRKMMPPNAQSVAQISRESGVSEPTLYTWRNHYRHEGRAVPADPGNPENWSGADKLAVVIETAAVEIEDLHLGFLAVDEDEQLAAERVLPELAFDQHRETIIGFAHIAGPGIEPDPDL